MPGSDETSQALAGRVILVTGASGFLGSCLVRQLSMYRCTIRRLHRTLPLTRPIDGDAVARIEDVAGDVQNPATWADATADADVVMHLAGQTSVYVAAEDPDADLNANVRPVLHLIHACQAARRRPAVIFAGTATEVGLTTTPEPVDEERPDRPVSIYDMHKLLAEQYLEAQTRAGALNATTLRLANVYGPGPTVGRSDRGFLNAMIKRALAGDALTVYGAGEFVRDYVYVDDVARAFVAAAASTATVTGRHFVIGSGKGTTIAGALECVSERVALRTGCRAPIRSVEPPAGLSPIEQRHFVAKTTAFMQATGWHPLVSLRDGIDRTIDAICLRQGEPA